MATAGRLPVTFHYVVGIGDVDAYGIMFYSHFVRISRMALRATSPLRLSTAGLFLPCQRFRAAVSFGQHVRIEWNSCAGAVGTLLCRWYVSGESSAVASCTGGAAAGVDSSSHCAYQLVACCAENVAALPAVAVRMVTRVAPKMHSAFTSESVEDLCRLFPAHVSTPVHDNISSFHDVLYWSERLRSRLIGGAGVVAEYLARGVVLQVVSASNCACPNPMCVEVSAGTVVLGWCFLVQQRRGRYVFLTRFVASAENARHPLVIAHAVVELAAFCKASKTPVEVAVCPAAPAASPVPC